MTIREKVVVMAYTGMVTVVGDKLVEYYKYLEEIFGRTVLTHEIPGLADEIKERSREDFIRICRENDEREEKGRRTEQDSAKGNEMPCANWKVSNTYPHNVYCDRCYKTFVNNREWLDEGHIQFAEYCPHCGAKMNNPLIDNKWMR